MKLMDDNQATLQLDENKTEQLNDNESGNHTTIVITDKDFKKGKKKLGLIGLLTLYIILTLLLFHI